VVSLLTRATDMADDALLRKAMYIQRSLLNVNQSVSQHRCLSKASPSCWLQYVSSYLSLFNTGQRIWKECCAHDAFQVPTSRTVQSIELNGIHFVRWEDDMLDEVCMALLNEWMKEIHGRGAQSQGRRCMYKLIK
jgi:hypothetical protein